MINVISINFKRSGLAVRSCFQFSKPELEQIYHDIHRIAGLDGLMILSTCNRTELYIDQHNNYTLWALLSYLQDIKGVYIPMDHFDVIWETGESATYINEVANGLHSLAFGDKQIIAQCKEAVLFAQSQKALSGTLERIFQAVFRSHKRISNETVYHKGSRSVSHLAVDALQRKFVDKNIPVLVIGAGAIATDLLKYLASKNFSDVTVVNRTLENAVVLANSFQFKARPYDELSALVRQSVCIISCVSAAAVITLKLIDPYKDCLFIDLTTFQSIILPADLKDKSLITLDTFTQIITQVEDEQYKSLQEVHQIIDEEIAVFMKWHLASVLRKQQSFPVLN